jgi:hypothetical protein
MIRVTSEELDNLELRLRLLAGHDNTKRATAQKCRRVANAIRDLSLRLNDDAGCRRIGGPDVLSIDDWQAADVVGGTK